MKTIGFGMPFGPFPKSTTGLVGGPQWGQSIGCQLRTKHSFHNAMKCHQQVRQCHIAGVFGQRADTPCHVWWFQWWLVGVYPPSFQEHWGGGIFRFFMFGCLSQVEMSCFFLHGYGTGSSYHQLGPFVSFQMQNGILGCPKNWINVLWPAYKMILVKNLQVYPAHVYIYIFYIYICYKCMLGMVYPGHTVTRCQ